MVLPKWCIVQQRNYLDYLKYLDERALEVLGNGFTYKDANEISYYVAESFIKHMYDETYTEMRVAKLLKGGIDA